jgi:hypothetical protein
MKLREYMQMVSMGVAVVFGAVTFLLVVFEKSCASKRVGDKLQSEREDSILIEYT